MLNLRRSQLAKTQSPVPTPTINKCDGRIYLDEKFASLLGPLRGLFLRCHPTAISGLLDFRRRPQNLEKLALLLVIVPHATSKTGRFIMQDLVIFPMAEFVDFLNSVDPRSQEILDMHKVQREAFQKEYNGQRDYATMAIMAKNEGPGKIPGDRPRIYRFHPVVISWPIINESPVFADPMVDWRSTLKMHTDIDG